MAAHSPGSEPQELHLAVALDGAGWHPAAWREPGAAPAAARKSQLNGFRLRPAAIPHDLNAITRDLVADRIDTQFVGSPKTVADKLEILQEATGANELIITTITHDHEDRVRSYQLLADEWSTR